MSSFINRTTSSPGFQFGATALLAGAVTAGAILGYQHVRRQEKVEDLKSSIPELGTSHHADKVCAFTLEGEMELKWKGKLMGEVKLTDFGIASPKEKGELLSKEDQRAVELATRAQRGDYDDGKRSYLWWKWSGSLIIM
jgi:hypothetical protein